MGWEERIGQVEIVARLLPCLLWLFGIGAGEYRIRKTYGFERAEVGFGRWWFGRSGIGVGRSKADGWGKGVGVAWRVALRVCVNAALERWSLVGSDRWHVYVAAPGVWFG